jgi:hypothetical protein
MHRQHVKGIDAWDLEQVVSLHENRHFLANHIPILMPKQHLPPLVFLLVLWELLYYFGVTRLLDGAFSSSVASSMYSDASLSIAIHILGTRGEVNKFKRRWLRYYAMALLGT